MSDIDAAIADGRVPKDVSKAYLSESRDDASIAGIIFVTALTTIIVVTRLFGRSVLARRFGLDDSLAAISLILLIAFVGLCIELIQLGSGRHFAYIEYVLPVDVVLRTQVLDFAAHIIYTTALVVCRLSGLAFYARICKQHRRFRITIWVLAGVIVAGFLPQLFLIIFHCIPVTGYWPYGWEPVADDFVCLQWGIVYVTNSVISLLCDFLLFGIPIAMLRGLNMPSKRKVQLACILLPGIAVVAISITRLVLVILGQWEADMSWSYNPLLGVEVSEIGATLIALSIPGAKQTWDIVFFRKKDDTQANASYYKESGGSSGIGGTVLSNLRQHRHHSALDSQEHHGSYDTEITADGDGHRGSQDRIYVKVDVQVDEGRVPR
ncbi:hypothetical protein CC79DRAFT_185706 [Sarocladium strictum]